jgi:hypothetical protein
MQVARILLFFSQMAALDSNGLVPVMTFLVQGARAHILRISSNEASIIAR